MNDLNARFILCSVFLLLFSDRVYCTFRVKDAKGIIYYPGMTRLLIASYLMCQLIAVYDFLFLSNRELNPFLSFLGFSMALFAIILRHKCIRALGSNWSLQVKQVIQPQLIITGPYKYVRHPYYLSVLIELVGVCLLFNSLYSFFFLICIHFPLLIIRIYQEEKILIKIFSKNYVHYKTGVGCLLYRF
jgi:protein-S-isoprenylcysteine O-methyltransferase Ste14